MYTKAGSGLEGGDASKTESVIFGQTCRRIDIFKTLQFLYLTSIIGGTIFPNHPWTALLMSNQSVITTFVFVLSGLLTHLRYRSFFTSATSFRESVRSYCALRFLVYAPIVAAAWCWIILLSIFRSPRPTLLQFFATFTFTSSWFTIYPIFYPNPKHLVVPMAPAFTLASAFLTCWILYPLFLVFFNTRHPRTVLTVLAPICCLGIPFLLAPLPNRGTPINPSEPTFDKSTLLGTALWYTNPLFVLPKFVAGMCVAEFVRLCGWNTPVPNTVNAVKFHKYVLPYFTDLVILAAGAFCLYNPRYYPSALTILSHGQWTRVAQYILLPWCCAIYALLCAPFASRGIVWKLLCQDPFLAVLPGRTAIIMSFFSTLVIKTLPDGMQKEIMQGAGFFFVCFLFFVTSIPFHYYVYQPFHLWLSVRIARRFRVDVSEPTSVEMETQSVVPDSDSSHREDNEAWTSPTMATPKIKSAECDYEPMKVLTSPHYDPFFPNEPMKEALLYDYMLQIPAPGIFPVSQVHYSFVAWFLRLFVRVHDVGHGY